MLGMLTGSTCGDMCWYAREDVCYCSCGGANHGCLRSQDGIQPVRTRRIDGEMYEMVAVGYELDEQARGLNKESCGIYYKYAHTQTQHWGYKPICLMRRVSESQIAKWPELAAYRCNLPEAWRASNPGVMVYGNWPGLPYALWLLKP